MNLRLRLKSLLLAAAASVLLAGCVNVAGASIGASTVVFLVALLGLGLAACSDDSLGRDSGWDMQDDTGEPDAEDVRDVRDAQDAEAEGHWESCCEGGQVSSCFCPANTACNYGWYDDCGDGTCSNDPAGCGIEDAGDTGDASDASDASDDADATDTSDTSDASDASDVPNGTWEPCCNNGQVDTCFCPAGAACNYGWYQDCGDGTCVYGGDQCLEDAGM